MSNKTTYQVGQFIVITNGQGGVVARKGKASNPDHSIESDAKTRDDALADLQAHIEMMENRKRDEIEDDVYSCELSQWFEFDNVPDFISNGRDDQLASLGEWLETTVIPPLEAWWSQVEEANKGAELAEAPVFKKDNSRTFQQQTWLLSIVEGTPNGPCEGSSKAFFWQMKPSGTDEPRRHTPESFQGLADKCREELQARIAKRDAAKQAQPAKMAAAPAATPATGNVLASLSPEQIAALPESILAKMLGLA